MTPWKLHYSESLGVECFQVTLAVSGKLGFYFFCVSCNSSVHFSGRTCHSSIQASDSSHMLLDEGVFDSHCCPHVGIHYSSVSHCKRFCQGCFSRLGAKGSAVTAFTPWVA